MDLAREIIAEWIQGDDVRVTLNLSRLGLTEVPDIPESVISLSLNFNRLTHIISLPSGLKSFDCDNNRLTHICELPRSLMNLSLEKNWLESLPQIPDSVCYLAVSYNYLTRVPNISRDLEIIFYHHNLIPEPYKDPDDFSDMPSAYHVDKIERLRTQLTPRS